MSKVDFSILFLISNMISVSCFLILQRWTSKLHKALANLTGISALATSAYFSTLFLNTYMPLKIAYGVYFSLMGWLCLAILLFIAAFTEDNNCSKFRVLLFLILILDSLSQMLNIRYSHALDYHIKMIGDEMFFELLPKLPFLIHLGICYILIGISLWMLIRKIIDSTPFYRIQYFSVMLILILIVSVNGVFVFTNMNVDVSMISYGFAAGMLTFYIMFLMPRTLIAKMSGVLLDKMNVAIFLFDIGGNMIYRNLAAAGLESFRELDKEEVLRRLRLRIPEDTNDYRTEIVVTNADIEQILDIQYIILSEQTKRHGDLLIGSYLIVEDITDKRQQLRQREYRAAHDELTGLYNRAYFCECAQKLLNEHFAERYAILMTNFSQFKLFNEVFGQTAGDQLLISSARNLEKLVQKRDGIVCCRYEADRFAVCLPVEFCTEEYCRENALYEADQKLEIQMRNYMGVCEVMDPMTPVTVLCERAAIALNTIKGDSFKRLAFYDQGMRDELLREKALSAALPAAIQNGHIKLYIQPQINQTNGDFVGGEVLARWQDEEGNIIPPAEFIPVLEKNGQITELDQYIWEESCKLASELYRNGNPVPLSVNLSAQDFFRCDIYETFTGLTEKYDLPPEYLRLEITEKEIMSDLDSQIVLIQRLQEKGFVVEMDDFGSGYSSLNTLKDIPVNVLKMDMRFLENTGHRGRGQIIIKNITVLAHELGLPIIAEGVELQEQADFLNSVDCKYIQGFLYGKPMPTHDFVSLRMQKSYSELK